MPSSKKYEAVIGLEVHAQLSTQSKIFCGCKTTFGAKPNSQTCPVCLGMPGVLPVLNEKAVEYAIRMGLATNCTINKFSKFARKNYFYPDLPKGYQISQYEHPLCENGYLNININDDIKKININRIHLEEDAGKSVHDEDYVDENFTFIDLNRCGTPLIEIVSEPDFRRPEEASAYLSKIRQLVRYLQICDGNMEEGSLRCDANISVRPVGNKELGVRTELKNMNSMRNVERALSYEINRQIKIVSNGGTLEQLTLLWDANAGKTIEMRSKEEEHDYRYFPDPDLVPLSLSDRWLNNIKQNLPELPEEKYNRFMDEYSLPDYDAKILTGSAELAQYFEKVASQIQDTKLVSNWMMGEVLRVLNEKHIEAVDFPISPERMSRLLSLITKKEISNSGAKKVFEVMLKSKEVPEKIVKKLGLKQISDSEIIKQYVEKVLESFPNEVKQYLDGKDKLISFFVGQVMKLSKGSANPQMVNKILSQRLQYLKKST